MVKNFAFFHGLGLFFWFLVSNKSTLSG